MGERYMILQCTNNVYSNGQVEEDLTIGTLYDTVWGYSMEDWLNNDEEVEILFTYDTINYLKSFFTVFNEDEYTDTTSYYAQQETLREIQEYEEEFGPMETVQEINPIERELRSIMYQIELAMKETQNLLDNIDMLQDVTEQETFKAFEKLVEARRRIRYISSHLD
jgi:hypothetical protein